MQPVSSVLTTKVQDPASPQTPVISKQIDEPLAEQVVDAEKAAATQELFNAGVQDGIIRREPQTIAPAAVSEPSAQDTLEKVNLYFATTVSGLMGNFVGAFFACQVNGEAERQIITEKEAKFSEETKVLFVMMTTMFSTIIKNSLPFEPDTIKLPVQKLLVDSMESHVGEVRKLSPRYLEGLQKVNQKGALSQIERLGQLVAQLESQETKLLQKLRDALLDKAKRDLVDAASLVVEDVFKLVDSVEADERQGILDGFVEGIDAILKKKSDPAI